MATVAEVREVVGELPFMSVERANVMTELIRTLDVHDILELGFFRGVSSCYMAAALEELGDDRHVVAIDLAARLAPATPDIERLLGELSLLDRVTIFYEYSSYNWRLYHFLTQAQPPQFDLVYLDGAHTWDIDGFAFLLAERLLAPGGVIVFDDAKWSIATSPSMGSWSQHMPPDERELAQVSLICDVLVKSHPNVAEYWEDGQWAFARKVGMPHRNPAARDAARRVLREQADEVRERGRAAVRAGYWRYRHHLRTLHPLTAAARRSVDAGMWDDRYRGAGPPWEIGAPQPALASLAEFGLLQGRVLDVGCGSGELTILATEHGADAVGVDISPVAVAIARTKAAERRVGARFREADALDLSALDKPFDVVVDCGLFETLDDSQRPRYAASLADVLAEDGVLYLMCMSDRQSGDWGPRRVSREEIEATFADAWAVETIAPCVRRTNYAELPSGEAEACLATIRRTAAERVTRRPS